MPKTVELGTTLRYGDGGHRDFTQPKDTDLLVSVANALCTGLKRTGLLDSPAGRPSERHDAAYFAPLHGLELQAETDLYLGLVHYTDGLEGTRRRMATAARVVEDFGIATECGLGRALPRRSPPCYGSIEK